MAINDLDIARRALLDPMVDVGAKMGLRPGLLEMYGDDVAKVRLEALDELADRPRARYVLVSAITPTPLGEGKTTTVIGLAQAFRHLGLNAVAAIRQPSMGPTFGIKGGAAGAGYSQVVPMERLNLHLTGDMHAVSAAHNLLAAMVDNAVHHGLAPEIDPRAVTWRRVVDMNDRALRNIVVGLGSRVDGVPRSSGFDITAASEVMAILALSTSLEDMRRRLGRIVVGSSRDGGWVTAEMVGAAGAMAVLMRDALKPNLLQTLENTPVLVHAGPFGNIAHGNSSTVADLVGVRAGDVLITEAGFGADMGAERFFNIKCRQSGLSPDAAVVVATVRALKAHSGRFDVRPGRPLPDGMLEECPDDVLAGADNLRRQVENIRIHGVTPVVAVNAFPTDHASEHEAIAEVCAEIGVRVAVTTHVADGGKGAVELAEAVLDATDEAQTFTLLYPDEASLREKITRVATRVYGASDVVFEGQAGKDLDRCEAEGLGTHPVCLAKTHLSLSADAKLPGAPTGWTLPVREIRPAVGAGFVTAICGTISTMPGLPSSPAAIGVDLGPDGEIVGLS